MPSVEGQQQKVIERSVELNIPLPVECLESVEAMFEWLNNQSTAQFSLPLYNTGSATPPADARDLPWQRCDENGVYLGDFIWSATHDAWILPGAPGELRTIVRSAETVEDDRKAKGLFYAWALADGSEATEYPGVPDLSPLSPYFLTDEEIGSAGLGEVNSRLDALEAQDTAFESELNATNQRIDGLQSDFDVHVNTAASTAHVNNNGIPPGGGNDDDEHTTQAELEAYVAAQIAEAREEITTEIQEAKEECCGDKPEWALYTVVYVG